MESNPLLRQIPLSRITFMSPSCLKTFTGSIKPISLNLNFPGPGFQPLSCLPDSCYFPKYFITTCFPIKAKLIPFLYPWTVCVLHQFLCSFWLPALEAFSILQCSNPPLSFMAQCKFLFLQEVFTESSSPLWAVFLNSLLCPIIRQLIKCCSTSQTFWTQIPLPSLKITEDPKELSFMWAISINRCHFINLNWEKILNYLKIIVSPLFVNINTIFILKNINEKSDFLYIFANLINVCLIEENCILVLFLHRISCDII